MERARKRKRPITSCGECYRRKQKCDRELPCAICVGRGVPEKCSFGDFDHLVAHHVPNETKKVEAVRAQTVDSPVQPFDLQGQTGYSLDNHSSFTMLHKALNNTDESPLVPNVPSRASFSRSVLSQIAEIELQLPSRPVQCKLIDLFISRSWWWFLGIVPGHFRSRFDHYHEQRIQCDVQQQAEKVSRSSLDFLALLFQVLAVSLQHLPMHATDLWKDLHLYDLRSIVTLSERFSKAGDQIIEILGQQNSSVMAVQHDMVKAKWLKNVSRGKDSWYSLASAVRQAQELGLHREKKAPTSLTRNELNNWLWQDVVNRSIWACLVAWDAHVAFTLGRPRIIHTSDCDQMKMTTHELPYDTYAISPADSESECSASLLTPVTVNYEMGYLIHDVLNSGANRPDVKDYGIVGKLHDRFCALSDSIPPYFRYSNPDTSLDHVHSEIPEMRFHLASMVNTYVVGLHRAHTLHHVESCDAAVQAALTTLQAQQSLFEVTEEQYWRIYTYSFFTIDAAIFLAALILEQPKTLSARWTESIMNEIKRALDRTDKMKEASFMAKTGSQIIHKCYERIIQQGLGKSTTYVDNAVLNDVVLTATPQELHAYQKPTTINDVLSNGQCATSPSLRSWIEQMDQVMLPMLESATGEPFDNVLWSTFLEY